MGEDKHVYLMRATSALLKNALCQSQSLPPVGISNHHAGVPVSIDLVSVDLGVGIWVIISVTLMCDASVVVGYDRKRPRIFNAINRKYDIYTSTTEI